MSAHRVPRKLAYVLEEGKVFAAEAPIVMPHDGGLRLQLIRLTNFAGGKRYRPLFGSGPGDRPHSISFIFLISLHSRGMARRQGARPGSPGRRWHGLRPGPGRETSRPAPCGAPTRHLRLTPQSAIGPRQELCVPGGFLPRPPVGQVCVCACPQVPLPVPAMRTPPEGAPRPWIGMNYT